MSFLKGYISSRTKQTTDNAPAERATADGPLEPPATPFSQPWTPHLDGSSSSEDAFSTPSRPGSLYPEGDFRNAAPETIRDIKCEVMVNWLHSKQEERIWTSGESGEGVVLKKSKGRYVCCPAELQFDQSDFYQMVSILNVRVAMTINTRVIKLIMARSELPYVELTPGLRLQVIPNIRSLPHCQKHQSAAFIAEQQILVVWEDDPKKLLERGTYIQDTLMRMIWGNESAYPGEEKEEKKEPYSEVNALSDESDVELAIESQKRPIVLIQPFLIGATLLLVIAALGGGWREIAVQTFLDRTYLRVAFAACIVPQIWLGLFFFQALVSNIAQIVGPIGQVAQNSKFYSGLSPRRLPRDHEGGLPHVTIQMPVYKEGLHAVIEPTIRSIKDAISTYELQGGTANIFVNDDGMQLLPLDQARERQDFYDEHNIGWVARPKHNLVPESGKVFNRPGKFKKASNMNYALWTSAKVEEKLAQITRSEGWTQKDETQAYGHALQEVIAEANGETWADGNIRLGDYILLIDSDTRVPEDCFLEAVSEMTQCPNVAIIQYASGVMNVTNTFFENGITFFTDLIYTQIRFAVANGDVAPFVGHNAILRWSAMQDIAYVCKDDGYEKYWSEKTVSEDFDMALRLQSNGYLVRMGGYKDNGFKEGVSLTVYDELARWEKYAYGCNELIFHPVAKWPTKGLFTNLFKRFIMSGMPFPSKVTIMAYVGTYYALGSAWILTLLNYFLIGWYNGWLDHYYIDSFKIYFSIVVVFTVLGNLALAILRYRIGERTLFGAIWENFRWVPLLVVFLGGIPLHVSQALLCHMFGIDMSWGATAKEVENVSFFEEIPRVIKRFKFTFIFSIAVAVMMVILSTKIVPDMWRITLLTAIYPLSCVIVSHFILPIALNPNLMLFTW
ncbi:glycosyl transferase family group 2-domain-containing protein [Lophiotrema nucula]|uniref:Glycosyl transferase family group 2-domain-containing protein n=1 Tax=Lophiotrema nucula TaxID=690887 RepID=A0A6A5YUT9_9PLEO|nr:glycosyl transferase family group 2-domain-containing protein [Lophiotrema nucula]